MKTFIEWLEINEAGFFANLFGGQKAPEATKAPPPQPAWMIAAQRKRAEEKARSDAWRASIMGQEDAPADTQSQFAHPTPSVAAKPQQQTRRGNVYSGPWAGKKIAYFDELYSILGGLQDGVGKLVNKIPLNQNYFSDMYDVYYKLSASRAGYGETINGLSDADIATAIGIIERIFRQENGYETFPDKDYARIYTDLMPEDVTLMQQGSLEADYVKIVVKGLKQGGRTVARAKVVKTN